MGHSNRVLSTILATGLAVMLAGCGGSDGPSRTTDTTTDASSLVATNPPHSIVITYPLTDAIQDDSWGHYRRKASVLVQDQEGHPVADGTVVYLSIMDSIIAQGTIDSPTDTLSGTVLTDIAPVDTAGDPITFDTAFITRNNALRMIEAGDMVLAGIDAGLADEADKYRLVADTALGNTTLPVTVAYQNTYPTPTGSLPSYASGVTNYIVGASLLGAQVAGESQGGTTTTLEGGTTTSSGTLSAGVATTVDGVAHFRITYPANLQTINTDCQNRPLDTRVSPVNSARVLLLARVNDTVTTISDVFCFSPITNGTIEPDITTIGSNGTFDIDFSLRDGGDQILVPFWTVDANVTVTPAAGSTITVDAGSATNPTAGEVITGESGWGTVRITVAGGTSGDSATVTLRALDTTAEITITIP